MSNKIRTYLILALIIAFGIFLRTYHIDSAPPGIYSDEAANGLDAYNAETNEHYELFYTANNGREGLFINLIAFSFKFLGISNLAFKLPSIIFGVLAIWGIYLLGTELFRSRAVGLFGAFLFSVSFWSINFSRIAFRAIMVPALLAFSFYFLFRGMRTKKWYDFALGGLFFGLGLHTYIAFRIAPLILVVMLFALILSRKDFFKNYWRSIVIFVVFSAISAGPMLYTFFVSHPEYWTSRTSEISILNPEVNQGHLPATLGRTLGLALAKYTFWGDQNWRQNYPPYAILDPLTGIAFLFGFIYSIMKFFHLVYLRFAKNIRDEKLEVFTFLLSGFFAMLLPEIMGAEGNPHALRSIGTMPFVFLFAALTFHYFWAKAHNKTYLHKKLVTGMVILMLLSIGVFNPVKYFLFWAKKPAVAKSFDRYMVDNADYFKGLPASTEKYFIADEYEITTMRLLTIGTENVNFVWPSHIQYIFPKSKNFVIIMALPTKESIQTLNEQFPSIKMYENEKPGGGKFLEFKY